MKASKLNKIQPKRK